MTRILSEHHRLVLKAAFDVMKAHLEKLPPGTKIRPREFQLVLVPAGLALSQNAVGELGTLLVESGVVIRRSNRIMETPGGPEPEKSLSDRVSLLEARLERLCSNLGFDPRALA